jgi:hypothetical protein
LGSAFDSDEAAPGPEESTAARDGGEQGEIKAPVRRRKLWLRAIGAAAVATPFCVIWWVYSAQVQKQAVEAARSLDAKITYADEAPFAGPNPAIRWLRERLGHDYTSPVTSINLAGKSLKENDLQFLSQLPGLQALWLQQTNVSDAEIKALLANSRLEELSLQDTRISDEALADISRLPRLEFLYLGGTSVTDAGLTHLASVSTMKLLKLNDTRVTPEGVNKLRQALPGAQIRFQ